MSNSNVFPLVEIVYFKAEQSKGVNK